ncbi:MAG: hypothetical protein ACJ76B_06970 [Solirubrobacterales bacterium]
MSSFAVFLVLGGATAFAASKIGANQLKANSVKTGKIVKEAVTTSKIKNGAVTTSKIADNAVTGAKADEASFGQVPTAKSAETAGVAGSASNVFWAVVSNPSGVSNATLVRSSQPAPTVTESTGVIVQFNRNISNCVWSVTRGATGEGVETAGFAEVGGATGNANAVDVRTRESDGSITDGNFHLVVICP